MENSGNDGKCGIELRDICHSFHGQSVLENVTLQAARGEILGLLGPSGAGKTTLVNIITGQIKPDSGVVYLDGEKMDCRRQDLSAVGVMMDNWGLYDRLSVYDNLKFYARIFGVPAARIDGILEKTQLIEAKRTLAGNLSKGMKSRVKLCRALLKDIKILFLDEPTEGLDPGTTKEIHRLILEQKQRGTTVFLTTHNMFEAESICDKTALLHQGRIVEYGTPPEICKRYNHLNKIMVQLKSGEIFSLDNNRDSAEQLMQLMKKEEISTIHSTEPDLEKVFLELTGRRLD